MERLRARASRHGRTPVEEAKAILSEALGDPENGGWEGVDAIYAHLAASGRVFGDSVELLREDRAR